MGGRGYHRRRIKTEQKAKVVAVGWGDILYLNAVLAARMIWTTVSGWTSILVGWWFGMVCSNDHLFFSNHQFWYSINPFLQIILVENSCCGKELNQFHQLDSNDDLLSSVFILLLNAMVSTYPGRVPAVCWAVSAVPVLFQWWRHRCPPSAKLFAPAWK